MSRLFPSFSASEITVLKALVAGGGTATPVATSGPTSSPLPTPINGAILTTFNLFNWGSSSSAGFARQGVVFPQGQVPAGSSLQVQFGGATVAAQFNARRTWPDGSLAKAVMHLRDTAYPAGTRRSYMVRLVMGTPFDDSGAAALASLAGGHDFTMTYASTRTVSDAQASSAGSGATSVAGGTAAALGSGTFTARLSDHMAVATRRDVDHIGAVCDGGTCWGMAKDASGGALDAHLKAAWHVDRWKNPDGTTYAVEIGCESQLNWWSIPGKSRLDYDATLSDAGSALAAFPGVQHIYNGHWLTVQNQGGNNRGRRLWVGGACPTLSYEPDRAYWIASGYVPPLNLSTARGPVPVSYAGNAVYIPLSSQDHRPSIDGTGGYQGRGCVLDNPDAIAVFSQAPGDVAAARIDALAGLHAPLHHRSNRQRTRPGEAADTANTPISLIMTGPGVPAYDFTAQGMPVPVQAYCDRRNAPSDLDGWVAPQGGIGVWGTSYGDGQPGSRSDDASHAVNYSYGMALLEGERYHMEATFDLAMNTLHQGVNEMHRIGAEWFGGSSTPTQYDAVAQFAAQERATAFSLMLIASAVALAPDAHVASGMFKRLNQQQGLWYQDMLPRLPADLAASGCHPWPEVQDDVQTPWQTAFNAMCGYFNWRMTGDLGIKSWAEHTAKWSINQARDRIYATRQYRGSNKRITDHRSATNLYQIAALQIDSPVVSIAAATGILTCTDYSRDNGCILYPASRNYAAALEPLTTELTQGTPYYIRDTNGLQFRLSASPGGPPVTFGSDYSGIHFLQDTINAGFNVDGPCSLGMNADDYPPMHRSVLVEAYRAAHPDATLALVNRMQVFCSAIPAAQVPGWATWDYAVPS